MPKCGHEWGTSPWPQYPVLTSAPSPGSPSLPMSLDLISITKGHVASMLTFRFEHAQSPVPAPSTVSDPQIPAPSVAAGPSLCLQKMHWRRKRPLRVLQMCPGLRAGNARAPAPGSDFASRRSNYLQRSLTGSLYSRALGVCGGLGRTHRYTERAMSLGIWRRGTSWQHPSLPLLLPP